MYARTVTYDVEWSAHLVGTQELEVTTSPGDGRLRWTSTAPGWSTPPDSLWRSRWRMPRRSDTSGRSRSIRRFGAATGRVRGHRRCPIRPCAATESSDPALRPRGVHLRGLAIGDRAELVVVGPGLAPDLAIAVGTIRGERPSDVNAGTARPMRYTFGITRHNAAFSGTLMRDSEGLPSEWFSTPRRRSLSNDVAPAPDRAKAGVHGVS